MSASGVIPPGSRSPISAPSQRTSAKNLPDFLQRIQGPLRADLTDAALRTNDGFGATRYRYWVFRLALDLLSSTFKKAGERLLAQPERSTRPFC